MARAEMFMGVAGLARAAVVAAAVSVPPLGAGLVGGLVGALLPAAAAAQQVTAFKQVIAEAASRDADVAAFYRANGFEPIWVGEGRADRARLSALFEALGKAELHGLPARRYDAAGLRERMAAVRSTRDLAEIEIALSRVFLQFAADLQTGVTVPARIDPGIAREVPYRERGAYLRDFVRSDPRTFFDALPPQTAQYRALMKARIGLERQLAQGGWGPAVRGASKLEPGDSGAPVVALRDRLVAMGYLRPRASPVYDAEMKKAVERFQADHGLTVDGVAGQGTLAEINRPVEDRLKSVIVAMERERWTNMPEGRGERHVLVNLPDFSVRIIDHGKETFYSRVVVGANTSDRRSPEFSDVMEHMVINPSWYVPRSIATKEYLPKLKQNPNAHGYLEITDASGRRISRDAVDFSQFTARSFPFNMRQPPGQRNALGEVKFMFPNKHHVYLHDTPHKNLFARESRAYSHGCIRVAEPREFAYALLAPQSDRPRDLFQSVLNTGQETQLDLDRKIPVHIIYRTAFADPRGHVEFRRDVYGRDAKVWEALAGAGVALRAVQG